MPAFSEVLLLIGRRRDGVKASLPGPRFSRRHHVRWFNVRRLIFPGVAGLVGLAAALSWFKPASVRVTGSLIVRSVSFDVDSAGGGGLAVGTDLTFATAPRSSSAHVRVEEISSIEPAPPAAAHGRSVDLVADGLRLTGLTVAHGGRLRISLARGSNLLRIEAGRGASFQLAAEGARTRARLGGVEWPISSDDEGSITIRGDPSRLAPMTLKARLADSLPDPADETDGEPPLTIEDAQVAAIRFGRDQADVTAEPFVSAIESGRLTIDATGETRSLEHGAPLSLDGFKGFLIDLAVGRDGVHVMFAGRATRLMLGPIGLARDIKPSWFDILYYKRWLRILSAALLGMIGTIAGLVFAESEDRAASSEPPA